MTTAVLKARPNNIMSNGMSTDSNDLYDNTQMNIHDNMSHNYSNNHHHMYNPPLNTQPHQSSPSTASMPNVKVPKPRKKRKTNDANASFEDEVPAKVRKRKSMFK